MSVVSLLICSIFYSTFIISQSNMINYRMQDGLPSNQIYQVHQDHNGLIWLATDRGISSFNGSYFNTYTVSDGLPDNVVFRLFPQKDGRIWGATKSKALFHFHPDTLAFHVFNDGSYLEDVKGNQIRDLQVDEDGTIKFRLIESTGYFKISKDRKVQKFHVEKKVNVLDPYGTNTTVYRSLSLDAKGGYPYYNPNPEEGNEIKELAGSDRDLLVYDSTMLARLARYGVDIYYKNGHSTTCRFDHPANDIGLSNGKIWVATEKGIYVFSKSGIKEQHLLESIDCSYYFEDGERGGWISTLSKGIYYYPSTSIQTCNQFNGLHIHDLGVDESDNLVVSQFDFMFHYLDKDLNNIRTTRSSGCRPVTDYYEMSGQVGNEVIPGGETSRYIKKLSDRKDVPAIRIATSSWLYIQKEKKGYVSPSSPSSFKSVHDAEFIDTNIVVVADKSLYLTTRDAEIIREINLGTEVNDVDVFDNYIYCGLNNYGVKIFDRNLSCIDSISSPKLKQTRRITELVVRDSGIWVASFNGLFKLKKSTKRWEVDWIGKINGLHSNAIEDLLLKNDTLYIGTRNGLNYFNIHDWNKIISRKKKSFFRVKNILCNDSIKQNLTGLAHYENRIQIAFEYSSYPTSNNLLFQYRLKGFEENWNYTKDRSVLYKSLPPGNYSLQIQPVADHTIDGLVIDLPIQIHKAFYRTWWFRLGILGAITIVLWLFFKYRILAYNRELIREILRNIMKRLKPKGQSFTVRSNGYDVRINSGDVLYVESNGNYINIHTISKKVVVREKLSNFKNIVPDSLEYLQIRRSVIVRLDQVTSKSVDHVEVGDREFKVGKTYLKELGKIEL